MKEKVLKKHSLHEKKAAINLMKEKFLRKHSLHGKKAAINLMKGKVFWKHSLLGKRSSLNFIEAVHSFFLNTDNHYAQNHPKKTMRVCCMNGYSMPWESTGVLPGCCCVQPWARPPPLLSPADTHAQSWAPSSATQAPETHQHTTRYNTTFITGEWKEM